MTTVEVSPRATRMLNELDARWFEQHTFVDNPLFDEVDHVIESLRQYPRLGMACARGANGEEFRRMLLLSKWHLYYSYDEPRSHVSIIAVWYATRGSGPPLGR